MARVKRGNIARKRRNKILNLAKGFRGGNKNLFRTANQRVMKALCNAYRDRRRRKRDFRRLWISRINASARINGTNYSKLINGMKNSEIIINFLNYILFLITNGRNNFFKTLRIV